MTVFDTADLEIWDFDTRFETQLIPMRNGIMSRFRTLILTLKNNR